MDNLTPEQYEAFREWLLKYYPERNQWWDWAEFLIPNNNWKIWQHPYFQKYLEYLGYGSPLPQSTPDNIDVMSINDYWQIMTKGIDEDVAAGVIDQWQGESEKFALWEQIRRALAGEITQEELPYWDENWAYYQREVKPLKIMTDPSTVSLGSGYILHNNKIYDVSSGRFLPLANQGLANELIGGASQLERDAFEWQKSQDLWERNAWQTEQDQYRWRNAQELALQRQQLELERQKALADAKAHPRNWIQAWYMENPLAGQPTEYNVDEAQRRLNTVQGALDFADRNWAASYSPNPKAYYPDRGSVSREELQAASAMRDDILKHLAEAEANLTKAIEGRDRGERQFYPAAPNTPEWLPTFAPTLQAGQEMWKAPVRVASGQLWNQTPYTQKQMLGGYMDWAGGINGVPFYEDYEKYVEANLPKYSKGARHATAYQV